MTSPSEISPDLLDSTGIPSFPSFNVPENFRHIEREFDSSPCSVNNFIGRRNCWGISRVCPDLLDRFLGHVPLVVDHSNFHFLFPPSIGPKYPISRDSDPSRRTCQRKIGGTGSFFASLPGGRVGLLGFVGSWESVIGSSVNLTAFPMSSRTL